MWWSCVAISLSVVGFSGLPTQPPNTRSALVVELVSRVLPPWKIEKGQVPPHGEGTHQCQEGQIVFGGRIASGAQAVVCGYIQSSAWLPMVDDTSCGSPCPQPPPVSHLEPGLPFATSCMSSFTAQAPSPYVHLKVVCLTNSRLDWPGSQGQS